MRSIDQLCNQLDLDRCAGRQGIDPDCSSRVLPGFAKNRDQQIGSSIHDLRLRREVLGAVHKSAHADNALHFREVSQLGFEDRQKLHGTNSRGLGGLSLGIVAADFAGQIFAVSAAGICPARKIS